jgi:hypothetical protein
MMTVKVWNGDEFFVIGTFDSVCAVGGDIYVNEDVTLILEFIDGKWRDDNDDLWLGWSVEVAK